MICRYLIILLVFIGFSAGTGLLFLASGTNLSDDQMFYWMASRELSSARWLFSLAPGSPFLALLSLSPSHISLNKETTLVAIYAVTSFCFLCSMYYGLGRWVTDLRARLAATLVSAVPFYVFGMTHWGFTDFELIRSRILGTVLAPVAIRWFFDNIGQPRVLVAYFLVGISSLLNLEGIFLALILLLTALAMSAPRTTPYGLRTALLHTFGFFCAAVMTAVFMENSSHLTTSYSLNILQALQEMDEFGRLRELTQELSRAEELALLWEAAYFRFWWGIFPPQLKDVFFIALNASPFLIALFLALKIKALREISQPSALGFFAISCVLVAYGLQALLFAAWKLFDTGPFLVEEVRAFKYILFPGFVVIGLLFQKLFQENKLGALALCFFLLCLPLVKSFDLVPDPLKDAMLKVGKTWIKDPVSIQYLEKSLKKRNTTLQTEVSEIADILRDDIVTPTLVLTDVNELRLVRGLIPVGSYQNFVRPTLTTIHGTEDPLLVWFRFYKESQIAIHYLASESLIEFMDQRGLSIVVAYRAHKHIRLKPLFEGLHLFLYVKQ
jgi:hypothetical protein